MAEREQAARHNAQDLAQRADIKHRDDVVAAKRAHEKAIFLSDLTGQLLGAVVALVCAGGAIYLGVTGGNPWLAGALVSLPVASIIRAFRSNGSGEPEGKEKAS